MTAQKLATLNGRERNQHLTFQSRDQCCCVVQVGPSNDEDSSDASGDAGASVGTGDAASTNGVAEGPGAGGMYYVGGMNGYASHGYVYDYPHGGGLVTLVSPASCVALEAWCL